MRDHEKRLVAPERFEDVILNVEMSVDRASVEGHGDILFRASELALGYEGNNALLGSDFLLGYSVQVHADGIALVRHDYDEKVLARWEGELNLFAPHRVRVHATGVRFQVSLDGVKILDCVDPLAHPAGGVGLRAVSSTVRVSSLTAEPM